MRRPWRETLDISLTKLAGLWADLGGDRAVVYGTGALLLGGQFLLRDVVLR